MMAYYSAELLSNVHLAQLFLVWCWILITTLKTDNISAVSAMYVHRKRFQSGSDFFFP